MIWLLRKLTAKWFGWQYVAFHFGGGWSVARLRTTPDNKMYILYYGEVIFDDSYRSFKRIL